MIAVSEGVAIRVDCEDPGRGGAYVDAKKMQRAIYNLLLNACQSARKSEGRQEVLLSIASQDGTITVRITDSGPGVAEQIRSSLFQPFVSEGKQSGTGLGLTLASTIAREHGGAVILLWTNPGETIFEISMRSDLPGTS
jgi:signal transduction histidine kinase